MSTTNSSSTNIRLSAMMFLQFFIWGSFFVPLGDYLSTIFAGREGLNTIIGDCYATSNWAALIAPLFVGLIADRFFNAERVNGVLHLIGGALLWWCSTIGNNPGLLFWGLLGHFMCYMPTLALVNTIAFQNVASSERDFPKIRLWGTIGWIVAGLIVAQSFFGIFPLPVLPGMEKADLTSFPMKLGAIASFIYGIYSFTLPATPPSGRGTKISFMKLLGFDALKLFKDRSFAVFALCSFLICIPLSFYYAHTKGFVAKVGFPENATAVMALGQVSEIVFMALVPFFFRRLGVKWMLVTGMLAWTLRYALFGLAFSTPSLLVLGIVLHGICYDFFFVTGQLYTDRKAPHEIRASAQGLIALLTYGAGMLVGNKVLGWWGDHLKLDPSTVTGWTAQAREFWLLPAGVALAVAILFAAAFWDRSGDTGEAKH
jgi:nucleoside transporter